MARGIKPNPRTDYQLSDVINGSGSGVPTQNKRWWMNKLMGPERQKYARMLMGLPPLEDME